jgi:hypothetical protein
MKVDCQPLLRKAENRKEVELVSPLERKIRLRPNLGLINFLDLLPWFGKMTKISQVFTATLTSSS